MKAELERMPFTTLKFYEEDINPNPLYQRGSVWKLEQRQLLIDSILRGMVLPSIYLRKLPSGNKYKYEIVDGQQRLRAIWHFFRRNENELKQELGETRLLMLQKNADDILLDGINYKIAGKKYSELNRTLDLERLQKKSINVVIISEADDIEIRTLFYRLNHGSPLYPAEVRNAMVGAMSDFIRELVKHEFFGAKCKFKDNRMAYNQIASQIVCLEINHGNTDISDRVLTNMFINYKDDLPQNKKNEVIRVLNVLNKVFKTRSKLLNKATTINYYLLISFLVKNTNINNSHDLIREWLIKTEPIRRKNLEYIQALSKSANNKKSINTRFSILLNDFLKDNSEFNNNRLDDKRIFTENQKIEIYARDEGKCQKCKTELSEYEWHADHKIPWIKGGSTTVENGQVLCRKHNLEKSDKFWD